MLRRRADGEKMNASHASTHNSVLNSVWFQPNPHACLSNSLGESQRNAPFFSTSFFFFLFLNQSVLRRKWPGLLS